MKILQISTSDIQGGAAKACHRLAKGLMRINEQCEMLVKYKSSTDSFVHGIDKQYNLENARFALPTFVQEAYVNRQRTDSSNTLFSLSYCGYDIAGSNLVKKADIVNLHWIVDFQSPATIARLAGLGKPIIWTLHDQWPFTGGCHYSGDCVKYETSCSRCPQLRDDSAGLIPALLRDKVAFFSGAPVTVVAPSRWIAECAAKSAVFGMHRVETIPNSLDTGIFSPMKKEIARRKMGLQEDGLILLFGSENGGEKRKGFKELLLAMQKCLQSEKFAGMVRNRILSVACFGHPASELESSGLHVIPLGFLKSDDSIRNAYCASDMFILPSLQDNLPNTLLEAMSCGIPVIAFSSGGIPDMINHGFNGLLAPPSDTEALSEAVLSLVLNSDKRGFLGQNGRTVAVEKYSLHVQAGKYLDLYNDILESPSFKKRSESTIDPEAMTDATLSVNCSHGLCGSRRYYDVLFKSFSLALRNGDFNRKSMLFRVASASHGLLDDIVKSQRRKGNGFVALLALSLFKILRMFRTIKRVASRG